MKLTQKSFAPALTFFGLALSLTMLFAAVAAQETFAQSKAKLVGKVTDKDSGEELIGVSITVVGKSVGSLTNVDGEYSLLIEPGTYDIRYSYVGYQLLAKQIVVKEPLTRQDIQLKTENVQAEEIVVQAEIATATEAALLAQQRKSLSVSDAISAEQIKRTPDSDAGEAIKRVTGVSLVGGKFVFVRGLGERYSSTQINGVSVPSPEPDKKIVPFDLISTNMIENMITIKTFLPDQPGNFGGGLVKIRTKEFPDEFQLSAGVSGGLNSITHFRDLPRYNGGRLDFLGFDDGSRRLQGGLPNLGLATTTRADQLTVANTFNRVFYPTTGSYGPNYGYNFAMGGQFQIGDRPLGYIASLNYGADATYKEQEIFFPSAGQINPVGGGDQTANQSFLSRAASYNVAWGGLFNLSFRADDNNKLGLKSTYNRTSEDETIVAFGTRALANDSVRSTRLRFIERALFSSQLSGNHFVNGLAKSEIEWIVAYASAVRSEPDNRETSYIRGGDGSYRFDNGAGRNLRFFSDNSDRIFEGKFDWSIPFRQWDDLNSKFKFGALYNTKNRNFEARRFTYRDPFGIAVASRLPPEQIFLPERIADSTLNIEDATVITDNFTAEENTVAGYAMVEIPLVQKLRFIGGARVERNRFNISYPFRERGVIITESNGFNQTNILPSLNLIWSPSEEVNFRLAFSQTVAQPELRELAPFRFDDYRTSTFGNPFIVQTRIQNYDLRLEWYPRAGEYIAVSGFFKSFDKPIERVQLFGIVQGTLIQNSVINAASAINFGGEFEFRKRLDFIASALSDFALGINVSILSSRITLPEEVILFDVSSTTKENQEIRLPSQGFFSSTSRPLQGQSPYIVNASLGYDNREIGLSATLLYNVVGRRIILVGGQGIPDAYEEPRNQVDFSVAKTFGKLQSKVSIKNILNDRYLQTIGQFNTERYFVGQGYALSFSYTF